MLNCHRPSPAGLASRAILQPPTLAKKRRFLQGKIDLIAGGLGKLENLPESIDDLVAEIERIVRDETKR